MKMKVSVIIPMYRVAAFIERCARSLMAQTLQDVEFIFVDDASPDDSVSILESVLAEYPDRNTRIISHETNKGLPSARNTGLAAASGDYIFHCDGDDWVEPQMLETMYAAAVEAGADFVWCDFYMSFEQNERYMSARDYRTADDLLRKGFLSGAMKYNVWNKLVRRCLYVDNSISFPDGHSMGEDMTMIMLASFAKSVVYVPEALYHYVKTNAGAYTQVMSERNLSDIRFNTDRVTGFLQERYGSSVNSDVSLFKLNVKLPFLISDDRNQYRIWREWYPEANAYVMANKELPFRTRLLQWCASHNLWTAVRLYYVLVYKFVYGIIYK